MTTLSRFVWRWRRGRCVHVVTVVALGWAGSLGLAGHQPPAAAGSRQGSLSGQSLCLVRECPLKSSHLWPHVPDSPRLLLRAPVAWRRLSESPRTQKGELLLGGGSVGSLSGWHLILGTQLALLAVWALALPGCL